MGENKILNIYIRYNREYTYIYICIHIISDNIACPYRQLCLFLALLAFFIEALVHTLILRCASVRLAIVTVEVLGVMVELLLVVSIGSYSSSSSDNTTNAYYYQ